MAHSDFDHVVVKFDEFGKGTVEINGHPLKSTLSVDLSARGGEPTVVTIRMVALGEADVLVGDTSLLVIHSLSRGDE